MAKTLEELLSQKKFTGHDAGLIHLYSVENDITSALKGLKPKKLYTQTYFDRIISRLSDEETENYQIYAMISSVIFETAKLRQTYLKELNSCFNKIYLTFQEIDRAERAMDVLPRAQRNDVRDILYTADNYLSDKKTVEEIESSFLWFKKAYSFIATSNFVQAIIFETYDAAFMNSVLFDMSLLDEKTEKLNNILEKVTSELAETKKAKFTKNIGKIDRLSLMPDQNDYNIFRNKIDLSSQENVFFDVMSSISSSILEIVNRLTGK